MSRNDLLEVISGILLIIMVAISFTNEKKDLLTALMVIFSISIFILLTYFSMNINDKELGLIKCECMLFCLLLMVYFYYHIDTVFLLIFSFILIFFTTSKEMTKRE
ncbi:MAG: hypothetical protein ACI4U3_07735 [Traorella sp.]